VLDGQTSNEFFRRFFTLAGQMATLALPLLALTTLASSSSALSSSDLFPFGASSEDSSLAAGAEDVSSSEVALNVPVKFFDREYGSIYVRKTTLSIQPIQSSLRSMRMACCRS